MFSAEFSDLLQIPGIRNDDSSFTLNRLKKYGCNIFIGFKWTFVISSDFFLENLNKVFHFLIYYFRVKKKF